MVTREQLEEILDNKKPFQTKGVDHDFVVIKLLRERIPYEVCKSIISGADHDIIYLCEVDDALEYLNESAVYALADGNVFIEDDIDSFALFV